MYTTVYYMYFYALYTGKKKDFFFLIPHPRTIFCLLGDIVSPVRMRDLDSGHQWYGGELYHAEIHGHIWTCSSFFKMWKADVWAPRQKATGNKERCWWVAKEESETAGSKLNIQKSKIMASDPITSWQTEGKKVEAMIHFIFLGSKITVDDDCSRIKRHLLLGRKAMINLDHILKSRDFIANKCPYSHSYNFSRSRVWM